MEAQNMGIGPLGAKKVFARTFRFLFVSKKKPEMQHFTSKVRFNYLSKTIRMFIYERVTLSGQDWIEEMMEEGYSDDFSLIALDGCGNKLYVIDFNGVELKGHALDYDYGNSDVVQHRLKLQYHDMVKTYKSPNTICGWDSPPAETK